MTAARICQIYYSEETRQRLDPGFVPLDNLANMRPDWREYWPIRQFLRTNYLELNCFYGFLSPKFRDKTQLDSKTVFSFLQTDGGDADVVIFSPFFDQMAYFLNLIEQGMTAHKDAAPAFRECIQILFPEFRIDDTANTTVNSVYCNFFVARPSFWLQWFALCEQIFEIAERNDSALARALNANTSHDRMGVPTKVFVIERIASVLLALPNRWRVKSYNPMTLPLSPSRLGTLGAELVGLDALKLAYVTHGKKQYKESFLLLRERYLNSLK